MTCKGILDALSDYLEGDAGSRVCNEIEAHLDGCEKCRMHIDTMRAVVTLFKGWRGDPIPDDVSDRLQAVIAETVERAVRRASRKPGACGKKLEKPAARTGGVKVRKREGPASGKPSRGSAKPRKKPRKDPRKDPRKNP